MDSLDAKTLSDAVKQKLFGLQQLVTDFETVLIHPTCEQFIKGIRLLLEAVEESHQQWLDELSSSTDGEEHVKTVSKICLSILANIHSEFLPYLDASAQQTSYLLLPTLTKAVDTFRGDATVELALVPQFDYTYGIAGLPQFAALEINKLDYTDERKKAARLAAVGIDHGLNFLRVQVKSTSYRRGDGYCCELAPNHGKKLDYSLEQIDLFAAYVIPVNAWYLIPASLVLGVRRISCVMLSPVVPPTKKKSYCYECYRDRWELLTKSRSELARYGGNTRTLTAAVPWGSLRSLDGRMRPSPHVPWARFARWTPRLRSGQAREWAVSPHGHCGVTGLLFTSGLLPGRGRQGFCGSRRRRFGRRE